MEQIILLSVIALCIIVFSTYTMIAIHKYMLKSGEKPDLANYKYPIEYTEAVLKFIKTFVMHISIIHYNVFIDSHDPDKINRTQIQHLVEDTAKDINGYIKSDIIEYDKLLVTKNFIDEYVIQTTIIAIKDLLNKTINNE